MGKKPKPEEPNTLVTNTVAKVIYLLSEGPVEGLSTGDGKSLYFDDVPLIDSDGSSNFNGVSYTFREGLPDQDHIPGMGSPSAITSVGDKVEFATPRTYTVTGNYDATNVIISIPQLFLVDEEKGNLRATDLSFAIDVKTSSGSYVTVHNVDLNNQKTTAEWRRSYRVDLPAGGSPWTVRVRRLTTDSVLANVQDEMYLAGYSTIVDGKFSYRNSSIIGVILPSKEFQGRPPSFKAKIKGIKVWVPKNYDPVTRIYATSGAGTSGGIWDGTFKAAWTNNPVWIFNDLLINNRYGLGQDFNSTDDAEIALTDKWGLYTISQFCDEMIDDGYGGEEPRYTINVQITTRDEAYQVLQKIITNLNGMIYFSSEKIYAVVDKPDELDDIFTQADVEGGIFEYTGTPLKTRHSAVVSYYNDPNNLYKKSVVIYEDQESIEQIGYRLTEIDNVGCTSRGQALRTAKWLLHTEKTQTQTVSFVTGQRGATLVPGAVIKVFDDYKSGERMGGRILSTTGTSPNLTFTMDAAISIPASSTFIYINADGIPVSCACGPTTNSATVTVSTANGIPIAGATFAIVKPTLDGQLYRVIATKEEDSEKYSVVALKHDESKFAIIDATPVFEDIPDSIYETGKLPAPTGIVVTKWWETVSGTEAFPRITVSWIAPTDKRIIGFECQLKTKDTEYTEIYKGAKNSCDSQRIEATLDSDYGVRVRSYDSIGRFSDWTYELDFDVPGNDVEPPVPFNELVTGIIGGYIVIWDNPDISDFKHVDVAESITTDIGDSTIISRVSDDFFVRQGLTAGDVKYVWIRTVTRSATNNTSDWVGPLTATAKGVEISDFDDEVTGIPIVDVLPNPVGYTGPPIVFLTTDQRLYTYNGTSWTDLVIDIPEDYQPGIPAFASDPDPSGYEDGAVYYNTTNGQLYILQTGTWLSVSSDAIISQGSSNPGSGTEGELFFNTTDGKLYRYHSSAWTAEVPATDISGQLINSQIADLAASKLTGQITTTQISDDAITTPKLGAGVVTAQKLLVGSIENIIPNGTNEDTEGGTYALAGQFNAGSGVAYVGSYVRRVVTPSTTEVDVFVTPTIPCSPGDKFYFESYGKLISGTQVGRLAIQFFNAAGAQISASSSSAATASWTLLSVTGTAPALTASVQFYIAGTTAIGTTYWDNLYARRMLTGELIVDGAISTDKLTANSVTAAKIATDAVTAGKIQAGSITTAKLAAGAITANELAANSVTAGKIAANTISATEIQSSAITTAKIAANAITSNELAANSVIAGKIAAGAVTANSIGAGTITVAINLGSSAKIVLDGVNNRIIISD
jgi:predicted phage tail protein